MNKSELEKALDYFEQEWYLNGRPYMWNAGDALAFRPIMFAAARRFADFGFPTRPERRAANDSYLVV